MDRPPLAPATNRPAVETHVVTEEAKPTRSGSPLANTLLGFDSAAARPAAERVCCARAPRPPPADDEGAPPEAEQEDDDDDEAELALLREQLKATEQALERRKREEAAATPFLAAVFEDATFAPPATPKSPPGLVAPEAARPQVQAAAAARDRLEQTRKPRRQRLSAKKQRETPVRVVVVEDEPVGCLLPSCFEETMTDDQVDVEVSRAPDESKNKLVVKVHRARRLFGGGYGFEAVGATHPYVRAIYGDQTRETACRRRTTSPCWQEELTFEARGATTVKLLFYSRNTYMADSLLGGCVVDLGARPEFSLGAPRPLVEKSWFSIAPEKRPTGPEDFLYRHRNALGSVEVSAYAYRAP